MIFSANYLWNSRRRVRKLLAMNRLKGTLAALLFFVSLSAQSADKGVSSEAVIVPAGTEIKVSVTQPQQEMRPPYSVTGKVVAPVRVKFVTAIPALSVAKITVTPVRQDCGDDRARHWCQVVNLMELTSVVVGDVDYAVSTATVSPIPAPVGLDSEISFVLQQPLEITPKSN